MGVVNKSPMLPYNGLIISGQINVGAPKSGQGPIWGTLHAFPLRISPIRSKICIPYLAGGNTKSEQIFEILKGDGLAEIII